MNVNWQVDSRQYFPTRMSILATISVILLTVVSCLTTTLLTVQPELCLNESKQAKMDGKIVKSSNNCYVLPLASCLIQFSQSIQIGTTTISLQHQCRHYTLTLNHQYDQPCEQPTITLHKEATTNTFQIIGRILSCLLMYRYIIRIIVQSYTTLKIKLQILKQTKEYCPCLQKINIFSIWLYGMSPIKPQKWLYKYRYVWWLVQQTAQKMSIDWMLKRVSSGRKQHIPLNCIDYGVEIPNDLDEQCYEGHIKEVRLVSRRIEGGYLFDMCGIEPRFTIAKKSKTINKVCNIIVAIIVIVILSVSINQTNVNYTQNVLSDYTLDDINVVISGNGVVEYGAICADTIHNYTIQVSQPVLVRLGSIVDSKQCRPTLYLQSNNNITVELMHFKVEKEKIIELKTTFYILKKCVNYVIKVNELQEVMTGRSYVEYIDSWMDGYGCEGVRYTIKVEKWKKVFHNVEKTRQSLLKALGTWGFVYLFVVICMVKEMGGREEQQELMKKLRGGSQGQDKQGIFDLGDMLMFLNRM